MISVRFSLFSVPATIHLRTVSVVSGLFPHLASAMWCTDALSCACACSRLCMCIAAVAAASGGVPTRTGEIPPNIWRRRTTPRIRWTVGIRRRGGRGRRGVGQGRGREQRRCAEGLSETGDRHECKGRGSARAVGKGTQISLHPCSQTLAPRRQTRGGQACLDSLAQTLWQPCTAHLSGALDASY